MTPSDYRTYWDKAIDYPAYRQLVVDLLAQGKTTGPDQAENMVKYTRKNLERMDRVTDIFKPSADLLEVMVSNQEAFHWLVITEAWCGDAAQLVPAIAEVANLNGQVEARFILRDDNPLLMDAFLTRGGRSIPLIIFLDKDFNVMGRWGPRPKPLQELIDTWKFQDGMTFGQMVRNVHQWYDEDFTLTFQKEMVELLRTFKNQGKSEVY